MARVVTAEDQLRGEGLAGPLEAAVKVFSHVAIIRAASRAGIRGRAAGLALRTDELLHLCALAVMGTAGTAELAAGLGKPRAEAGRLMRDLASEHLVTSTSDGSAIRWTLDSSGRELCGVVAAAGLLARAGGGDPTELGRHAEIRGVLEILADELGVGRRLAAAVPGAPAPAPSAAFRQLAEDVEVAALIERVYRSLRQEQAGHLRVISGGALDTPSFMVLDLLRSGPKPAHVLCERLALNHTRLLEVVGGLERQGLVDRRRRQDQIGTVEINPTDLGRALLAAVAPFDPAGRFMACMVRMDRAGTLGDHVDKLQFHVTSIGRGHVYPPRYGEVVRALAGAMASGEVADVEPSVSGQSFRAAMGEFATGVAIVTVATAAGARALTVNSFTSVSLEPPIVLVCLRREIATLAAIEECGRFGISVLPASMEGLARRFGTREGPGNPHSLVDVEYWQEGDIPGLRGALAWFGCRVDQVVDAGDHVVVLAAPEHIRASPGGGQWPGGEAGEAALFFWRGRFGAMP